MKDRLATIYVGITLFVSVLAVGVMLLLGKPPADDVTAQEVANTIEQENTGHHWYVTDDAMPENSIEIVLPAEVKKPQVSVENDYRKKELRIVISKGNSQEESQYIFEKNYFMEHPVRTSVVFGEANLSEDMDAVCISIPMALVREVESKYEAKKAENVFWVQMVAPKDKYEKIVVLDAGHGGRDRGYTVQGEDETELLAESELAYDVVSRAGAILEKEGICVYYTRGEQENPNETDRVSLANEVQADMFISVHGDFAPDTALYGMRTVYNETYFIPAFASADLAYLLLEKVASSTNEKAIGFEADDGQNELIRNAMVPVAQLNIGYLSNKQEQKLLTKDDYIQRIADGICNAVFAGYEEIEK